jgi:urea transport system permease protein
MKRLTSYMMTFVIIFMLYGVNVRGLEGLSSAQAQEPNDQAALSLLTTDKFTDTEAAIAALMNTSLPNLADIISALAEGRLYFNALDKTVFIKKDVAFLRVDTGLALSNELTSSLKKVRLNNAVRAAVQAAQGSLGLRASDADQRMAAAEAVFKGHDEQASAGVEAALAREQNPYIKKILTEARAAIILSNMQNKEIDRLGAIDILRQRGDQEALNQLLSAFAQSDGRVKSAAGSAVASIQSHLAILNGMQNIWYGLSLGSVLLLAAIGLAITFGVMGIINMAHGEMVMLGAYTTYGVQEMIRQYYPALFDYSLLITVPLAFCVTAVIGMMIERGVIRFLYGRPLETLLATFGLSLILQQSVRSIFGANNREVGAPHFMSGAFDVAGLSMTSGRMWIIIFTIIVFIALQLLLRKTAFGLRMRAVTQNRRMAAVMGIDTNRIYSYAFGLGSGIAGIAGVALSQIDNVSPNLGQSYIIDSFMVVVFGGVGNLWGTLVAAFTLGIANKFLEPLTGAVLGKIIMLLFIIIFIQRRPRGLFAQKGRAVEA